MSQKSFFGFDNQIDLEAEKRKFLEGGAQNEDIAVYTWGEDSYDGLGDALQEGGDELNDETFGGSGPVGKDFDFASHSLPLEGFPAPSHAETSAATQHLKSKEPETAAAPSRPPPNSLESIWDDKSPFSVLPKSNGSARASTFSPFDSQVSSGLPASGSRDPAVLSIGGTQTHGVRTLEEIEAEMRAAFAAQRNQNISPSQSPAQILSHAQAQAIHRATPQRHMVPPHAATPPPRMHPHSQSPRFHQQQQQHQIHLLQQQQQRQLLELQEQRKRQEQLQLLELQEQLRLEEMERQAVLRAQQQQQQELRAQHQMQLLNNQFMQQQHRQSPVSRGRLTPSMSELQQHQRRYGRQSPASIAAAQQQQIQQEVPFQHSLQYLPRDIQMQQRLLAEMAQAEFLTSMQGASPLGISGERESVEDRELQEALRAEAMRKIMEAERMEEKRRKKLEKIRHMSRYNDLMTQSDKDFITRIQVSQLVTQDPYADDFYAQVFGALMRSKLGLGTSQDAVLKFGSGGGVGLGVAQVKGQHRRPSAMQRMEQQVERIVNSARLREKEKSSLNSLQGALGKTSGRSYKAAPRQLLQVNADPNGADSSPTLSHANPHAHISKADALDHEQQGNAGVVGDATKKALGEPRNGTLVRKDPLTARESLVIVERLYDMVLELEQQRRTQPVTEDPEAIEAWEAHFQSIVDQIYDSLQILVPLDTSNPHPFISLLTPIKGKRILPRITRHMDTQRNLTILTLFIATFSQLDVVVNSGILDTLDDTQERADVEAQTQAFLGSVMQSLLHIVGNASLPLISGILEVFMERNDVGVVARTRPGIALLTMFLSRVEVIKENMASGDPTDVPSDEERDHWQDMYDVLFRLLTPHLVFLFPSVRQAVVTGLQILEIPQLDVIDQPVWQFLAALALNASLEQQQILVTSLRERVLENVTSAAKGWVAEEENKTIRLANVNIFLHALGLDSSQIAM
ncbi:PAT1 family protein [Abortiporus biennis]